MTITIERVKPLDDRLLIELTPPDNLSEGGIFMPEVLKDPMNEGIVVAVGPGKLFDNGRSPLEVRVGDKVRFQSNVGTNFRINGKVYKICKEEGLHGILLLT